MAFEESIRLASKFRGCMLGTLLGDCLGAPFEGDRVVDKKKLQVYFDSIAEQSNEANKKKGKFDVLNYTDDSAMTKQVAKSLLAKQEFDASDMARRFVKEYLKYQHRGYGGNVIHVFKKLKESNFVNVYGPAKEQFDGQGSFGNGGAMRIAPVALYYHQKQAMVKVARKVTQITHTNRDAVNGAILQCLAVDQCLHLDPREPLDSKAYLHGLQVKMEAIESEVQESGIPKPTPYKDALKTVEYFLSKNKVSDKEVVDELGNDISAKRSVPTAVFCFLKAMETSEIPGIKADNPMQRTIQYAISLGGDTDTIACMAGALAGAFLGDDQIQHECLKICEASDTMAQLGNAIYKQKYQKI